MYERDTFVFVLASEETMHSTGHVKESTIIISKYLYDYDTDTGVESLGQEERGTLGEQCEME